MSDEDIVYKDKFNNKVTISQLNNGDFKKLTQTTKFLNFDFLGQTYSFKILDSSSVVKVYWDEYHSERKLIRDRYGRLFHYRYDEEMNFGGGSDREDFLWTFVLDEEDSDKLSEKSGLALLREPFVAADETEWTAAHEFVDSNFVERIRIPDNISLKPLINFIKNKFNR